MPLKHAAAFCLAVSGAKTALRQARVQCGVWRVSLFLGANSGPENAYAARFCGLYCYQTSSKTNAAAPGMGRR
jgi:hypothetical protein